MKKLTMIPAALLICAGAYGQGQVSFNNGSTTKITVVGGALNGQSFTAANGWKVDLLYQTDSGPAPAAVTAAGQLPSGWLDLGAVAQSGPAGEFLTGKVTLPGLAVDTLGYFEVIAFNGSGTSAATATSAGYFGNSAVFTLTTTDPANGSETPKSLTSNPAFTAFSVVPVPEPTTIALGGLGAASLLLFRRKK